MDKNWLKKYFDRYRNPLFSDDYHTKLLELKNDLERVNNQNKGKSIILGNGGSAAIASHVSVDFSKNAKIRMINFNESDLITCLANDYGYENWMAKALEIYSDPKDIIILISSSGKSKNVLNAAEFSKSIGQKVVTFTGFDNDNPLKTTGDLNFWVDSYAYNIIEMMHQIWLLAVCDAVIGNAEYPAS